MTTLIVKRFNAEVGYAIAKLENGTEIYLHRGEIATPGVTSRKAGDQIALDVYRTEKGAAATNIRLDVVRALPEERRRRGNGGKPTPKPILRVNARRLGRSTTASPNSKSAVKKP